MGWRRGAIPIGVSRRTAGEPGGEDIGRSDPGGVRLRESSLAYMIGDEPRDDGETVEHLRRAALGRGRLCGEAAQCRCHRRRIVDAVGIEHAHQSQRCGPLRCNRSPVMA